MSTLNEVQTILNNVIENQAEGLKQMQSMLEAISKLNVTLISKSNVSSSSTPVNIPPISKDCEAKNSFYVLVENPNDPTKRPIQVKSIQGLEALQDQISQPNCSILCHDKQIDNSTTRFVPLICHGKNELKFEIKSFQSIQNSQNQTTFTLACPDTSISMQLASTICSEVFEKLSVYYHNDFFIVIMLMNITTKNGLGLVYFVSNLLPRSNRMKSNESIGYGSKM
jgi:hypothetical protein